MGVAVSESERLLDTGEHREELSLELVPHRDHGNPGKQRFVGIRANTVAHEIEDEPATWTIRSIFVRSVNRHRIMETSLARFHYCGHRKKCVFLFSVEVLE